jgi:hypothetical protein
VPVSASIKHRAATSEWHEHFAHATPPPSQPDFLAVLTSNAPAFEVLKEQLQAAIDKEALALGGRHTGCSALMHACALSAAVIAALAEAAAFYGDISGRAWLIMHM